MPDQNGGQTFYVWISLDSQRVLGRGRTQESAMADAQERHGPPCFGYGTRITLSGAPVNDARVPQPIDPSIAVVAALTEAATPKSKVIAPEAKAEPKKNGTTIVKESTP